MKPIFRAAVIVPLCVIGLWLLGYGLNELIWRSHNRRRVTYEQLESILPGWISTYRDVNSVPPTSEADLRSWLEKVTRNPDYAFADGWGNRIMVLFAQDTVVLLSRGPDGLINTYDDVARVFVWTKGAESSEPVLRKLDERNSKTPPARPDEL
jgi:hypothetical protein